MSVPHRPAPTVLLLILTIAAISTAEVVRAFRWLNLVCAAWLIAAPWILTSATSSMGWNDLLCGVALFALTLPRGTVRERYAAWDRWIR